MASIGAIELLTADAADLSIATLIAPTWGIYLAGSPVILPASVATSFVSNAIGNFTSIPGVQQISGALGIPSNLVPVFASTVDFEYAQDWPISNYPQEQGAFQSYDKVTLPFDVKIKLAAGGSATNRQSFINACLSISNSITLFDVVTPEWVFNSCSCTHIDWRRDASRGVTLIAIDLWFQQINVVSTTNYSNTQQPGNAGQQANGNAQPMTPNQVVQQSFDAFGAN